MSIVDSPPGASMRFVTALPADPRHQDPGNPERILRELPERERGNFLSQYREALDGAQDPAGWKHLRRVLRLWSWMVVTANQPGHYEAREQALAGIGEGILGILLEDWERRARDGYARRRCHLIGTHHDAATRHARPRIRDGRRRRRMLGSETQTTSSQTTTHRTSESP
jgi:hypothetical protein